MGHARRLVAEVSKIRGCPIKLRNVSTGYTFHQSMSIRGIIGDDGGDHGRDLWLEEPGREPKCFAAAFPSDFGLIRHTSGSLVGIIAGLTAFRCDSIIRFVEECRLHRRPHFEMRMSVEIAPSGERAGENVPNSLHPPYTRTLR